MSKSEINLWFVFFRKNCKSKKFLGTNNICALPPVWNHVNFDKGKFFL